jgi:hypothetical protein
VLVGDFESVEDPQLEDVRNTIVCGPSVWNCRGTRYCALAGLRACRHDQPQINRNNPAKSKGPMRSAFVTQPPARQYCPLGLDPLVVDMNREVEHSH